MKFNTYMIIALILIICSGLSAQQEGINYQTILEDRNGDKLIALDTEVQVVLRENAPTGTIVYTEGHEVTTGLNGEVQLVIGEGIPESISFAEVDWSQPLYIEIRFRPHIFTNFFSSKEIELLAVPYALFSLGTSCEQGCPGEKGPDGPQGATGPQGPKSPVAGVGPMGDMGPQGNPGISGMNTLALSATPPPLPQENEIYLDDGTNRNNGQPGFRQFYNGQWSDL